MDKTINNLEIQNKVEKIITRLGEGYPLPKVFDVEDYYSVDVIRKEDLVDGKIYIGLCRNTTTAKWDAKKDVFTYLRVKFYHYFFEDINHISDDDGYDLFIPIEEVKPT